MNVINNSDYKKFFTEIKTRIAHARHEAYRTVNKELVLLYWDIGKGIVKKQKRLGWGEAVVERLAGDLQREFGGMKGFSKENLWRMRKFYETYPKTSKLSPLVTELSWSHNQLILFKAGSIEEKEFYIKTAISERWSRRELDRQLDSALFERYMLSKKPRTIVAKTKEKRILWRILRMNIFLIFLGFRMDF